VSNGQCPKRKKNKKCCFLLRIESLDFVAVGNVVVVNPGLLRINIISNLTKAKNYFLLN
jgi:hypothetical protein